MFTSVNVKLKITKLTKNIVTILGDSLSMVRVEEGISIRDTYPFRLNELLGNDFYVVNRSKRGNTSVVQSSTQNLYDDIETSESKVIIIQIGICDCSPRIISKFERVVLNYALPKLFAKRYIKIKSKYRYLFTKYFPMTYVSLVRFETSYEKILASALKLHGIVKVVVINIADTNSNNKLRSFNFDKNIVKYNSIISKLVVGKSNVYLLDLYNLTKDNPELLLTDGIHINLKAHEIIASELVVNIKNSFRPNASEFSN